MSPDVYSSTSGKSRLVSLFQSPTLVGSGNFMPQRKRLSIDSLEYHVLSKFQDGLNYVSQSGKTDQSIPAPSAHWFKRLREQRLMSLFPLLVVPRSGVT